MCIIHFDMAKNKTYVVSYVKYIYITCTQSWVWTHFSLTK